MPQTSKLIQDLTKVPNIVGGLGLSIAAAQKAFNLDYIENVERILALAKSLLGGKDENGEDVDISKFEALFTDLLVAVAPPRYQYSETTLGVRLDLAQTFDLAGDVGLGFGMQGISINAAFSIGYGYDYRAAAECRTVIHAIPADNTVFQPLLERAKELNERALTLPAQSQVDRAIIDQAATTFEKALGVKPAKVEEAGPA